MYFYLEEEGGLSPVSSFTLARCARWANLSLRKILFLLASSVLGKIQFSSHNFSVYVNAHTSNRSQNTLENGMDRT